MLKEILEKYPDEVFLKLDGLDDAIIGVDENSMKLIYSINKCINILSFEDFMGIENAIEYFDFNIRYTYFGEKTPIFKDERNYKNFFI